MISLPNLKQTPPEICLFTREHFQYDDTETPVCGWTIGRLVHFRTSVIIYYDIVLTKPGFEPDYRTHCFLYHLPTTLTLAYD